jgi:hypothetical protein
MNDVATCDTSIACIVARTYAVDATTIGRRFRRLKRRGGMKRKAAGLWN